ncbi:MAG TPA: hypothetical protein PLX20_15900 [Rhodocyclaceae bacterium]|nr:hypothetical protein [Rhodocyclaceae bacterium]HMV54735.1 hypothetical protein [Rhodocyclaceae bacterium]HNA04828.1 hypothetical protein [Rhodocyclaceae bacterium]HNB80124.1 hypothetical protein [Rhodocyclaceae bacterium]HNH14621.1 hypothetical protein [Rhodocyclaceae bacterium]
MKPRNREINIFNLSMLDVICGALGAFLILFLIAAPSYSKKDDKKQDTKSQQARKDESKDEKSKKDEKNKTKNRLHIVSSWEAPGVDIDMWIYHGGEWIGPKDRQLFGRYKVAYPTQELPAGNGSSARERIILADPPGGIWLIVYHYRAGNVPSVDVRGIATWAIASFVGDVTFSPTRLSPGQVRIASAVALDSEGPGYAFLGDAWNGGPWPSGVGKFLGEPEPASAR